MTADINRDAAAAQVVVQLGFVVFGDALRGMGNGDKGSPINKFREFYDAPIERSFVVAASLLENFLSV